MKRIAMMLFLALIGLSRLSALSNHRVHPIAYDDTGDEGEDDGGDDEGSGT